MPLTKVFAKAGLDIVTSSYVLLSAVVRARRSMFSFCFYFQLYIFNWAFVPGWTFNEFPAFANTRTLAAML
jgi:hypothetical protein